MRGKMNCQGFGRETYRNVNINMKIANKHGTAAQQLEIHNRCKVCRLSDDV